jgi:lipopolysaccharide cholinephosphotransferase
MKSIDLEELKSIQLDIVQVMHNFCIENDIKYSLACGSLLGAVRHSGYIPWDDDIDVYLERTDYKKLIKLFPKVYKGRYELIHLENNEKWNLPYAKLYDNRTLILEKVEHWIPIGVNIDIFPLDKVPENDDEWNKYNKNRIFLRDLIGYKAIKPCKRFSFVKNVLAFITMICFFFISRRFHAKMVNWYAQRFNEREENVLLFECVQGIFQKKPFSKEDFVRTIMHKFEDRELCIMEGYDHCLRRGFGDYLQLPPIEKRISHHSFNAYWL